MTVTCHYRSGIIGILLFSSTLCQGITISPSHTGAIYFQPSTNSYGRLNGPDPGEWRAYLDPIANANRAFLIFVLPDPLPSNIAELVLRSTITVQGGSSPLILRAIGPYSTATVQDMAALYASIASGPVLAQYSIGGPPGDYDMMIRFLVGGLRPGQELNLGLSIQNDSDFGTLQYYVPAGVDPAPTYLDIIQGPIPEPSALSLTAIGVLFIVFARRRSIGVSFFIFNNSLALFRFRQNGKSPLISNNRSSHVSR